LIFQKTSLKYLILILFVVSFMIGVLIFANNSCNVDRFVITNDIVSYEKSLDPEICENILERIDLYNDHCESEIEILDCG